jgi:hypothetical protein
MSENVLPESNIIDNKPIDRIYQNVSGTLQLVLKDGSIYRSKIDKKSIKLNDGTLAHVFHADGKWFDRMGMPIKKPDNLVTREKNAEEK